MPCRELLVSPLRRAGVDDALDDSRCSVAGGACSTRLASRPSAADCAVCKASASGTTCSSRVKACRSCSRMAGACGVRSSGNWCSVSDTAHGVLLRARPRSAACSTTCPMAAAEVAMCAWANTSTTASLSVSAILCSKARVAYAVCRRGAVRISISRSARRWQGHSVFDPRSSLVSSKERIAALHTPGSAGVSPAVEAGQRSALPGTSRRPLAPTRGAKTGELNGPEFFLLCRGSMPVGEATVAANGAQWRQGEEQSA